MDDDRMAGAGKGSGNGGANAVAGACDKRDWGVNRSWVRM